MSKKEHRKFIYVENDGYDKEVKINGEKLKAYSAKKLKSIFPNEDYVLSGETFEKRKRNRNKDIGRIELNEIILNVGKVGSHCKLLRKKNVFVETQEGFIVLLRKRALPIILFIALLLCCSAVGIWGILSALPKPVDTEKEDPNIKQIESDIITVSGTLYYGGKAAEGVRITLLSGKKEVISTTTDKNGNYLISGASKGVYNIKAEYNKASVTYAVAVDNVPIIQNLYISDFNLSVNVDIADENTPPVAVNGLNDAAQKYISDGKHVDITLVATKLEDSDVPENDSELIKGVSGQTALSYFDFSIFREVFSLAGAREARDDIYETDEPLEIIVPYDTSKDIGTYVFRSHNGEAVMLSELSTRPKNSYEDGTYFVTADNVFIYTKYFSTYAIGSASIGKVTKGSDTITYSDKAYINLRTKRIDMLYQHGDDSTNDVRVELYIVGESGNLLVAESGIVPIGCQLAEMTLKSGINNMPSVGTYNGLMKIIYLGTDGNTSTNVEIPLSIAITQ